MENYSDFCTACVMKDAKLEMLQQELGVYKEKLREYERRQENKSRGSVPWDEPYERRRYPPSGYD